MQVWLRGWPKIKGCNKTNKLKELNLNHLLQIALRFAKAIFRMRKSSGSMISLPFKVTKNKAMHGNLSC